MQSYQKVILLTLLVCAPVFVLYAQGFGSTDKILNPYHQQYDPDQFRFEDYSASKCLSWEVLAKLFPPGTPKSFVDRVLVSAGGAKVELFPEHVGHNLYGYYKALEPPLVFMSTVWNVSVHYDNSMNGGPDSVYDYYDYCLTTFYRNKWGIEDE
jgi:hypothetical protein